MRKLAIPLFLIAFLISSCDNSKTGKADVNESEKMVQLPYIVDLEKKLDEVKLVNLSSIGSELEYIALETKPNSLLRKVNEIELCDSFIFISDFNKLLQFDRSGKFIRQIGSTGRGPGEYIYVMGFAIDQIKHNIFIKDYGNSLVKEFDFNGQFIRSFKISFESTQFLVGDKDSFIFNLVDSYNATEYSDYKLFITDINGLPINMIKNYHKRSSKLGLAIGVTPMYFFDKVVRFMQFGVDTLYTLENGKIEPYAIFNLGNMKMDSDPSLPFQNPEREEILNKLLQKLWINDITENKQNLFLELNYGINDSAKYCVLNKLTSEISFLEGGGFVNDIDGGIAFWPKYVFNNNVLVDYYDAITFMKRLHNEDSEKKIKDYEGNDLNLRKLENGIDEMANPVLIILK
jgi:hypothetical protein